MSEPTPGFYPDPSNPGLERWWDGQKWTDATRMAEGPSQAPLPASQTPGASGEFPMAPPPPPPPPPPGAAAQAAGQQRSGYYVWAWVTAFLCCLVVPIVLNVMDNNECKTRGLPPKWGPTITAIIINIVGGVGYLILAAAGSGTSS